MSSRDQRWLMLGLLAAAVVLTITGHGGAAALCVFALAGLALGLI